MRWKTDHAPRRSPSPKNSESPPYCAANGSLYMDVWLDPDNWNKIINVVIVQLLFGLVVRSEILVLISQYNHRRSKWLKVSIIDKSTIDMELDNTSSIYNDLTSHWSSRKDSPYTSVRGQESDSHNGGFISSDHRLYLHSIWK